ncbi:FHA domain-containing protein [Bifidobacterium amazonense]|uniref:FHA domain-containing protein n=1 Tax=Bifidobacterium amazonense TaxID=2809027 RepID=A0ABS9VY39_9BIFI|nr:FHA domain-containing protein [Bifidobacterium amazonense]MCH9277035.1 FHA domain-containing protein [Bifidobacterium amazonense]
MLTELTFAILKYGFLVLLWVFVWLAMRSLHKDMETLSPHASRTHRRKERRARKAAESPAPVATSSAVPVRVPANEPPTPNSDLTLLVIIDGPLAGASVPLTGESISLGRAASNTVVLDDEFVSSHHARVYQDPATGDWAIEDLNSTNGTVVNGQRISAPTILSARVPVRIGSTTFELR